MRKLALMLSAFGFVAFAGVAHAGDQKTENSEKTSSGTTITGRHKTTSTKKVVNADGSEMDSKTEVTGPKRDDDKRADADRRSDAERRYDADRRNRRADAERRHDVDTRNVDTRDVKRNDDNSEKVHRDANGNEVTEKTEHHTTLMGKKETKSTKKVERPDGTEIETTTTKTEPKK